MVKVGLLLYNYKTGFHDKRSDTVSSITVIVPQKVRLKEYGQFNR